MICGDREEVKPRFEQRLTDLGIEYEYRPQSPDSSWGDIQFKNNKRTVRVFFKNQKQNSMTPYFEGAQCIYMAVSLNFPDVELTLDQVKKYARKWSVMDAVNIDKPLNLCLTKLPYSWSDSSAAIARHVLSKLRRTDYTFHRANHATKAIDDAFYRLNRGAFTHVDKWNPYDILLISREKLKSFTTELKLLTTLAELNAYLRAALDENTIVPISLKKVKRNPTIYSVNTEEYWEKQHEPAKYITVKVNTGKSDITSSNNCQLSMEKYGKHYDVVFRPSSPGSAVNGEVKQNGASTQDGKIGLTTISDCFAQVGWGLDVTDLKWHNRSSAARSPILMDRVWEKASRLDDPGLTREQYDVKVNKVDKNWLYAMDIGTNIIEGVVSLDGNQRDQFCELLYQNGAAQRRDCGPYLKVMERCD